MDPNSTHARELVPFGEPLGRHRAPRRHIPSEAQSARRSTGRCAADDKAKPRAKEPASGQGAPVTLGELAAVGRRQRAVWDFAAAPPILWPQEGSTGSSRLRACYRLAREQHLRPPSARAREARLAALSTQHRQCRFSRGAGASGSNYATTAPHREQQPWRSPRLGRRKAVARLPSRARRGCS